MGHTRIGRLNRSQKWKDVVAAFGLGAESEQISRQVLDAVEQAFNAETLSQDAGYQKAVELLVQMGIAAQSGDFISHMRNCGIELPDHPTVQDLNAGLMRAMDDALWETSSAGSMLGEYAKNALCQTVSLCVRNERSQELPGLIFRPDLDLFNSFGKRANFAGLNQNFIAKTFSNSLKAYVSQILPNLTGTNPHLLSTHEVSAAYDAMDAHCRETAVVHRVYSTEWLGKHQYQLKDMDKQNIMKHANFMVKKMIRALKYGKD